MYLYVGVFVFVEEMSYAGYSFSVIQNRLFVESIKLWHSGVRLYVERDNRETTTLYLSVVHAKILRSYFLFQNYLSENSF